VDIAAEIVALVVAVLAVTAVGRRLDLSAPLCLFVVGVGASYLPGIPEYHLSSEVVLIGLLPPLLYSAAIQTSLVDYRKLRGPIALLSVGLVVFTTFAVGLVAWLVVPGLPLAAGIALGAVVAPPDAVAASAVARRVGMPRKLVRLLEGESLFNDAAALVALRTAIAAIAGSITIWQVGFDFLLAAVAGAVVGVALGAIASYLRTRLTDLVSDTALSFAVPFVAYLVAEEIHGSGVLAVVVAALILGQKSTRASYATRLQDTAVWKALQLILESFAFLMIGLQLPMVVSELAGISASVIAISSVAVLATVIGVRLVWVFTFTYLPRMLFKGIRDREPAPPPAQVFVVAWAGMRGVVSLAAAFGVPMTTMSGAPFPGRPQLVFLTFVVVIGTLLLHGLTLPWLIRRLGVRGDEAQTDAIAAAAAQDKAARAAAERLDEMLAEEEVTDVHERAADVLRGWNTRRRNSAWERLGRDEEEIGESPASAFRRLRLEMLAAERATLIAERDSGQIDDEVLREVLRGLDLEEATLNRG